jgi:hypothetical protein
MATVVKEPSLSQVDGLEGIDAVVCLIPSDERPLGGASGFVDFRLCGALSRALKSGFFKGEPGEKLLLPSEDRIPAPMLFAVGLGPSRAVTLEQLDQALQNVVSMVEKAGAQHLAVGIPHLGHLKPEAMAGLLGRRLVKAWRTGRVLVLGEATLEPLKES